MGSIDTKTTKAVKAATAVAEHHKVRTFFASLFGLMALWLLFSSITVIWLNRTLTDTNTFVSTVQPLAQKPEVQDYIAQKISTNILENAPKEEVAANLLKIEQVTGKSPKQVTALVDQTIQDNVKKVLASPNFAALWGRTVRTTHSQVINQLNGSNDALVFNFNPAIVDITTELKTTELAPIADKIQIDSNAGNISLKGGAIEKAHNYYDLYKKVTVLWVLLAIISLVLCVLISVHHTRTLRKILIGTGFACIVSAFALKIPTFLGTQSANGSDQAVATVVATALTHNLFISYVVGGILCLVIATSSKLYEKYHS